MRRIILLFLAAALLLPAAAFAASSSTSQAVQNGASYIASLQQPGGGFGGSSIGQDADAIIAIRSAGYDPSKLVASDGKSVADFISASAASATAKPADAAKLALAAEATGENPASVGGTNLVSAISAAYSASTGRYASDDFSQAIAMLGLACTGGSVPAGAVNALESAQIQADGGWGFQGSSDPDTTAIATQALLAAGVPASDPAIVHALAYFASAQLPDGGWGYAPASNVNSTAYVIQALLAAGKDPSSAAYTKGGVNPYAFIISQQQADGSFAGFSVALAAEQALPALAGRTFCNAAQTAITQSGRPPAPSVTPTPNATTPAPTGGTPSITPTPAGRTPSSTPPVNRGGQRTPAAPNTGSGTGTPSGPPIAPVAAALLVVSLAAGAIAIKRRH